MKLNRRALMNKKLFLNAVISLAISTAFATNIHAASDDRFDGGDLDEGLAEAIAASLAMQEAEQVRAERGFGGGGYGPTATATGDEALEAAMAASRAEAMVRASAEDEDLMARVLADSRAAEEAAEFRAMARAEEEDAALRAAMQASVDAMAAVKPTLTSQRLGALTADIHSAIGTRNLRAMKRARVALLTTLDGYTATAEQEENMAILMTLIDPAIAEIERHASLTARASAVAAPTAMGGDRVRVPAQPQAAESVEEETTTSVAALIARFGGGSKAKK